MVRINIDWFATQNLGDDLVKIALEEHQAIVEALIAGDGIKAGDLLRQHTAKTFAYLSSQSTK